MSPECGRVSCLADVEVPHSSPCPNLVLSLQPGDVWTLLDQCHTVTCLPDGQTLLKSHRVNCDQGLQPSCPDGQTPMRMEEACGCRWACPCESFASSAWAVFRGWCLLLVCAKRWTRRPSPVPTTPSLSCLWDMFPFQSRAPYLLPVPFGGHIPR